ncbi:tyrosine-type recombinase/integrase [Pseudomonas sp. S191]|uniref:Tyr recombinase domain-containing protein n=1 Tax=Pseudomonas antarctica TaxID=219572 RepID=A0A172Z9E4_9PSED|nr:hypothetical protein A7J50_5324 [Pseudomonas antarctica]
MAQKLAHSKITALKKGTLSEALDVKGSGSLIFERRISGILVYLSLRRDGKQERLKLGGYDDRALVDWRTYAAARSLEVREFSTIEDYQVAQSERQRTVQRAANLEARQGTFAQLLDAYVEDMERRGKTSAKEVRGALKLNVLTPFPELSTRKAKEVEPGDIAELLRHCLNRPVASKGRGVRLTKANATNGKKRQADKLRSYLQAAFSFGLANDLNPLRAGDAVQYGLKFNPARDVPTIEGANQANTWALTKDELRAAVLAVEDLPERRRAIAKAMLYLAGQRVEMLCRVTWQDLYDDGEHGPVMRLLDLKGGKGTPPREHLLPMVERLGEIMAPLLALESEGKAPGPFSLRGKVTIAPGTALDIFQDLGERLAGEGKARRFTWRNMRATIETHLAALGVNQERRAWLLSHGRSGVQAKHYDRWNYLPEKRADLDGWARYLDELVGVVPAGNVVQLRGRHG